MSIEELHEKIASAKRWLNNEVVKIRTNGTAGSLNFREIGERLDLIHEVERIGIRNLNEIKFRKISRMLSQLEQVQDSLN